jgi:hypothetical protein
MLAAGTALAPGPKFEFFISPPEIACGKLIWVNKSDLR